MIDSHFPISVRSWGTEGRLAQQGRHQEELPPNDNVYDYIVFRAADVKDLKIDDANPKKDGPPPPPQAFQDPAILGVSILLRIYVMNHYGCKGLLPTCPRAQNSCGSLRCLPTEHDQRNVNMLLTPTSRRVIHQDSTVQLMVDLLHLRAIHMERHLLPLEALVRLRPDTLSPPLQASRDTPLIFRHLFMRSRPQVNHRLWQMSPSRLFLLAAHRQNRQTNRWKKDRSANKTRVPNIPTKTLSRSIWPN